MTENAAGEDGVLAAAAKANEETFDLLVRPHLPVLARLASRLGPRDSHDDIVQEALVRAWRHIARYDPKRGPLVNWLLRIVANEARRATMRRRLLPIRLQSQVASGPEDDTLDLEIAVRRLPPRQQLAVDCFYFVGLSISQTAAVMGCSEGTVKSTLADARARLRQRLEVDS